MNEEFEELYAAPEKKKKKSDPKLCILMLQFTACLLLATAAICIRFFGGPFYEELRTRYIAMFEDDTSVSEVLAALTPKAENGAVSSSLPEGSEPGAAASESSLQQDAAGSQPAASSGAGGGSDSSSDGEAGSNDGTDASGDAAVQTAAQTSGFQNALFRFDQVNAYAALSSANALYMPTNGIVSSEYGYRVNPVTGIYTLHSGIDLAAEEGTPVYAALAGEVVTVGNSDSYGIYIEVEHTGGVRTLYAHLSAAKIKEGATVRRGGLIGLVGSTGRSTGPHLHFEVSVGGETLNPRYLLSALEDS